MPEHPPRVVLDCDTANEVDDQFAIAHALGLPPGTLDVRGVVSVHDTIADGPASRDIYQEEAEKVVTLCGSDVPCIPGAGRPMETPKTPVKSKGLDFLIEESKSGPLTIIATGPATDVASMLLVAPEVRENVRVVWLGGFGDGESYERFKMGGELNGRADVAAWRALFEDPVELLQVPGWSGPHKLVVNGFAFAEELRTIGNPVADYLAEILIARVEKKGGELGPEEKILWDVSCITAVSDPEAVTIDRLAVPALDAAGAHDFSQRGREIDVLTGLDEGRVLEGMVAALERHLAGEGS